MKLNKNKRFVSPIFNQLFLIFITLLTLGCSESSNDDNSILNTTQCPDSANYTVTFESTWSSVTHPMDFPPNPHFSGLIGATHNDNVTFWSEGEVSSIGIERMAESGSKIELTTEITAAINEGNAEILLSGSGINPSPGSTSLQFNITSDYSKVTLVSMVAPSPDWFVGVSSLDLCDGGNWISSLSIDLYAYDAGTDNGTTYTSANEDTNPKENIMQLTTGIFEVNGAVPRLGTFTFIRN